MKLLSRKTAQYNRLQLNQYVCKDGVYTKESRDGKMLMF